MFFHNINPVFLDLGFAQIRYYGLVYFVGFVFAYFFLRSYVKKGKIKGMHLDNFETFMIYLVIGSIVGARVLEFVFYNPQILFSNPLELFRVWNGGMSIHGGIIGAFVATAIFTRKNKVSFHALADVFILPLLVFLGIGRVANFINGELWGTVSNSAVCIDYSHSQYVINPPAGCRHPYQLYASLKNFFAAAVVAVLKTKSELKEGLLFWWGILLYSSLRFVVDFVRDEPRWLGISTGQWLSLVFTIVAIVFIVKLGKTQKVYKEKKSK